MASRNQNIDNELLDKAKACTSPEELEALLRDEGAELSDEDLDGVAGGGGTQISHEEFLAELMRRKAQGNASGDTREGINSNRVPVAFANGDIDGSAFF